MSDLLEDVQEAIASAKKNVGMAPAGGAYLSSKKVDELLLLVSKVVKARDEAQQKEKDAKKESYAMLQTANDYYEKEWGDLRKKLDEYDMVVPTLAVQVAELRNALEQVQLSPEDKDCANCGGGKGHHNGPCLVGKALDFTPIKAEKKIVAMVKLRRVTEEYLDHLAEPSVTMLGRMCEASEELRKLEEEA